MIRRFTPFALAAGFVLATQAYAFDVADIRHSPSDDIRSSQALRLQDDRQCLQALETLALRAATKASDDEEFYAVLVNGDPSPLHTGNVEYAYQVLRSLGVPEGNIFVLSHTDPRPGASDKAPLVTAQATTRNLRNVLYHLSRQADANDCLLLYCTGHGIREDAQSALCLDDGLYTSSQMAKSLEDVKAGVTVVLMDQCFSGGFADRLARSSRNVVAMTNTDGRHDTYCEYFAAAFWTSLLEPAADLDEDGSVSFAESYEVAMAVHRLALADTPERTRGRFITTGRPITPAVNVTEPALHWTQPVSATPVLIVAPEEIEARAPRSHLARR